MVFFLLLFLFILPHCYGAANSLTKQADQESFLFLPFNSDCDSLIQTFKAVRTLPTYIKNGKEHFFSHLPKNVTKETVLKQDFQNRLKSLAAKTCTLHQVFQRFNEFKDSNFFCIKIKPIKIPVNFFQDCFQYSSFLEKQVERVLVNIDSQIVEPPMTEVDVLSNYFTQRNMINLLSERLKGIEEEKNKLVESVNVFSQKGISLEQEKTLLEKQFKTVKAEKKKCKQELGEQIKNKENTVVELQKQLQVEKEEKQNFQLRVDKANEELNREITRLKKEEEIKINQLEKERNEEKNKLVDASKKQLAEKTRYFEEQLAEQTRNAEMKSVELTQQLDAAKKQKKLLDESFLKERKDKQGLQDDFNLKKQVLLLKETQINKLEELIIELKDNLAVNKLEIQNRNKTIEEMTQNYQTEKYQLIAEFNTKINQEKKELSESGIMAKLKKISKWKALGLTVLGSLISILAYNRHALKNLDVQSCLKWVQENGVRFSNFVQLQYLLARAHFRW